VQQVLLQQEDWAGKLLQHWPGAQLAVDLDGNQFSLSEELEEADGNDDISALCTSRVGWVAERGGKAPTHGPMSRNMAAGSCGESSADEVEVDEHARQRTWMECLHGSARSLFQMPGSTRDYIGTFSFFFKGLANYHSGPPTQPGSAGGNGKRPPPPLPARASSPCSHRFSDSPVLPWQGMLLGKGACLPSGQPYFWSMNRTQAGSTALGIHGADSNALKMAF
jgi:hypothetical protein